MHGDFSLVLSLKYRKNAENSVKFTFWPKIWPKNHFFGTPKTHFSEKSRILAVLIMGSKSWFPEICFQKVLSFVKNAKNATFFTFSRIFFSNFREKKWFLQKKNRIFCSYGHFRSKNCPKFRQNRPKFSKNSEGLRRLTDLGQIFQPKIENRVIFRKFFSKKHVFFKIATLDLEPSKIAKNGKNGIFDVFWAKFRPFFAKKFWTFSNYTRIQ